VWNNMLDPDPARRAANLEANVRALALADDVGAACCVNIAGSFHPTSWDGPHPRNLSQEAFELTVQNVRWIIDAVDPKRALYTLETMPWVIPDSPDSYLRLIEAVDHPMFGVHLDPVNMIRLHDRLTVHLDEVRPGQGALDYRVFLQQLDRLPGDVPLLLEHLPREEYPAARDYVMGVAAQVGLTFHAPGSR
jgi:sugar phosphate isomerase/epimerase